MTRRSIRRQRRHKAREQDEWLHGPDARTIQLDEELDRLRAVKGKYDVSI